MHLLNTSTASLDDAVEPIDLRQPPADVLILSFSDTDLIGLARAASESGASVRLTHLKNLRHPMSVDLWIDHTARHAKLIIVRMLGGLDWWRYGVEQLQRIARTNGIKLAILPGEDRDDPRLAEASTLSAEDLDQLLRHFRAGGPTNMRALLNLASSHLTPSPSLVSSVSRDVLSPFATEDQTTAPAGIWLPNHGTLTLDQSLATLTTSQPLVPIIFYRSALLADDLQPITALCAALEKRKITPLPIFVTSLKDPAATAFVTETLTRTNPAVIVTTTAFAAGSTLFDQTTAPVLQVANAVTRRDGWQSSPRGLNGADLAMNVVLPELDGRVLAGVIAFKDFLGDEDFGGLYARPEPDRVEQVADRIARQIHLQTTPAADRRVAMILPDYPGAPGRTGWAVGLDAPESVRRAMLDLAEAGHEVGIVPRDSHALLGMLETEFETLSLDTYRAHLATLPCEARTAIEQAWGAPETDTNLRKGVFHFRAFISGNLTIALAPDRGRATDRRADYHDPALPPRHALLAFGLWLRNQFRADAIVHMGAHGTLEWLPGKAVALSASCWPELVLGALPVIYPFIVNNPGEAAQAKRRIAAITLGHLPPPAAETGLSGKMRDLERLVDEYAAADGMDPRRRDRLAGLILDEANSCGVAATLGLTPTTEAGDTLRQIDAWLCDLKDLTVKDGLHIYGRDSGDRFESADSERKALLTALSGHRILPGPAGSPARGRRDVLPTGRNLTTADPRMLPTQTAMDMGKLAANEIIRLHMQEQGEPPRSIVLDLWGSATLRTGGEEIAQGLALLGCQPIWDHATGRVTGIEVLPPAIMGRARVDVTFRISGLFRDLFPAQIALLALAVKTVAARNETDEENPLAAAHRDGSAIPRIFGTAPGAYGAGIEDALASGDWTDKTDLAAAYIAAGSHSYETDGDGHLAEGAFATRLRTADALVHAHDNPDRDLLEGSADAAFIGGFATATGKQVIILDTTNPNTPRARPLDAAIARIVHGRATDPRFIAGQMRHGPRGASELLETVDRLLNFAETSGIPDHLIDLVHAAYVVDPTVNAFLLDQNPTAAREMAKRFLSALRRNIWHPRRNDVESGLNEMLYQP
jgi:cobaltochelatase CobN